MMYLNVAILVVVAAAAALLWLPRLRNWPVWRAMTTPLASIIGSGFLVLGPVLAVSYGVYAPLIMAVLCGGAYLFGAAIRYNMLSAEKPGAGGHVAARARIEPVASASLAFAYMISVAYYLNLFGAFGVSLTPFDDRMHARLLASAIYLVILFVGWSRGFKALEAMEYVSVSLKLAIIAGLIVGVAVYFFGQASHGHLIFTPPSRTGWSAVTLAFGLIVTVQGFETSRYLGKEYDTPTLVGSMRLAQWVSSAIYLVYILLIAYVFDLRGIVLKETSIIDMMTIVAPILSILLVAAALAAQFSAAVADTSGSGGLLAELTGNRVSPKQAYAVLVIVGLALTWTANVFEIISYASRAFAIYYGLQALIAAITAWHVKGSRGRAILFAALAALGLLVTVFGVPVES